MYVYLIYVASGTYAVNCDIYVCMHKYRQEGRKKDGRKDERKEGRKEAWVGLDMGIYNARGEGWGGFVEGSLVVRKATCDSIRFR